MRTGIPGVAKCRNVANNGAQQYYVDSRTLKAADLQNDLPVDLLDSTQYKTVPRHLVEAIKESHTKEPASTDRIQEILAKVIQAPDMEHVLVGCQAISLLALDLIGGKVNASP